MEVLDDMSDKKSQTVLVTDDLETDQNTKWWKLVQ